MDSSPLLADWTGFDGRRLVLKQRIAFVVAIVGLIGLGGVGCARSFESSASGEVIDPAAASKTVVLHVDNRNQQPMELRTVVDGRSTFIGSVGGNDTTSILLDPMMFPAGSLYIVAVPADGVGRAIVGPMAASKGDRIEFSVSPGLTMSHAIVRR
jgi:hypothetical protein